MFFEPDDEKTIEEEIKEMTTGSEPERVVGWDDGSALAGEEGEEKETKEAGGEDHVSGSDDDGA